MRGNELPYSTQMSGISVIYPRGLDICYFIFLKCHLCCIKSSNSTSSNDNVSFHFLPTDANLNLTCIVPLWIF
jgi:hypothetical protein